MSRFFLVQSVYRTFLRRHKEKPFQIDSWASLWALLVKMTVMKCCSWYQHFYQTQRRDVRREAGLRPAGSADSGEKQKSVQLVDREPTPLEAALLVETLEETMRALTDRERQIIKLGLLGDPDPEIGRQVGRTQYTVRRMRKQFADMLHGQDEAEMARVQYQAGPQPPATEPGGP